MSETTVEVETFEVEKDTLISINGLPFWLAKGSAIHGTQANYLLATSDEGETQKR